MAIKTSASTRAPRGTKTLTQAFFAAADSIPEAQRNAVVKAALLAIRDQLKVDREREQAAKAKAKETDKAAAVRTPKGRSFHQQEPSTDFRRQESSHEVCPKGVTNSIPGLSRRPFRHGGGYRLTLAVVVGEAAVLFTGRVG